MGVDLSEFGSPTPGQARRREDAAPQPSSANETDLSEFGSALTSDETREASGGATASGLVFQLAAGFNDVVGTLVDVPAQATASVLEQAGLIDEGDVPTFVEVFNKGVPEATTPIERIFRDVGRGTASATAVAAPVFRGAQLAGQAGQRAIVEFVADLVTQAGLKSTLSAAGVDAAELPSLAAHAAKQWTGTFNPRKVTEKELLSLYEAAY